MAWWLEPGAAAGLVLFIVFVNDLGNGTVDDTKVRCIIGTLEGRVTEI